MSQQLQVVMDNSSHRIDISDLSPNDQLKLQLHTSEFRLSVNRLESEFLVLCTQVSLMHEILGDRIYTYAEQELRLKKWTVRRYLRAYSFLKNKLSSEGMINTSEAMQFNQGSLCLLSSIEDDDVIAEVRELAQSGLKIDEATVNKIIKSKQEDYELRIALAQSEADKALKDLQTLEKQRELDQARSSMQLAKSEELIRRAIESRAAVEADYETLQKQSIQIVEKEVTVEIVPKGYSDAKDAIEKANSQLKEVLNKNKEMELLSQELLEKQQSIKTSVAELEASTEEFLKIKGIVDSAIQRYPLARLKSITNSDARIAEAIVAMGQSMVEFGKNLCGTSI